ncbi:hypothetical protein EXIGLDRAFT_313718 [Exidia glandulosa HHB12029]|uniref:Uncharacterized protein n=1 Tax=Exidia glandulosa HHB12029 TaxID=1314781 RepID=A0A165LUG4_EXIGL|nr:hypothetical protein EXIGLDRAFT_313718 [Exidia glandulosa HHB12029]
MNLVTNTFSRYRCRCKTPVAQHAVRARRLLRQILIASGPDCSHCLICKSTKSAGGCPRHSRHKDRWRAIHLPATQAMSLSHNVSVHAQEHARILSELAKLEYAPSALETAKRYFADLKTLIADAENELTAAEKAESKESAEAQEVKKSVFRKLAHRATGQGAKWDAKATKEEREYVDARERRVKAESNVKALKATLRETGQNVESLTSEIARRDTLLREQQELYSRVFDGPTPDAPQEDELERTVRRTEDENTIQQNALNLESQTLSALTDSKKALDSCLEKMLESQNVSDMDFIGTGVNSADIWEKNAITAAQIFAQQFTMSFGMAKRLNPAVQDVPEIKLPSTSTSEVVFDNIWDNEQVQSRTASAASEPLVAHCPPRSSAPRNASTAQRRKRSRSLKLWRVHAPTCSTCARRRSTRSPRHRRRTVTNRRLPHRRTQGSRGEV